MNKIYRLIWSRVSNTWVAVSENSKGRGKSGSAKKCVVGAASSSVWTELVEGHEAVHVSTSSTRTASLFVCAASMALLSPLALAAPTGGQISAGSGTIAQAGLNTTITQTSQNLAINWQGFNIAANEAVRFNQPNASAIALNRVTGQNPSQILGSLSANGQVFILNPNGVLFGAGSQVNVGGLVASTLSLSDADFMAGKNTFSGSGGSVVNQGNLTAAQAGYIALLAPEVRNEGVIVATLGTALLAAGDKVTLNLNNGSLLSYSIDRGSLNALAENKQLIQADGGQVFMSAKAADALSSAVVNNTGIIEARTIQNINGTIKLMGDMQVGTVNVGGTLDASAPNGGNGGQIETSAAHVHVADNARVTTAAAHGLSGTWLIDPVDFTIAASGGDMTGAAVATALAGGNFSILSSSGASGTAGDVNVNDTVSWSANKLTLNAQNNININAAMNVTASASLALVYGQGAVAASNTSNIITGAAGVVNLPAGTTNFTTLQGSNGVVKNYTVITSLGAAGSTTAADLQGMNGGLGLNYVLGANIDACLTGGNCISGATAAWNAGAGFAPVGNGFTNSFAGTHSFDGTFDGLGHTISNLTINRPTQLAGLFGVAISDFIRNVGLIGGNVTGGGVAGELLGVGHLSTGSPLAAIGSPYGAMGVTISNSYATGNVTASGVLSAAGGLVGVISGGNIRNSYATGNVSGVGYAGGLVGEITTSPGLTSTISNCHATGSVSSTGYGQGSTGGLVGLAHAPISNSYATGSVSSRFTSIAFNGTGGLAGVADSISNSYATGNVSGSVIIGGLVGIINGSVSNSYATGSVSGSSYVGGLVGENLAPISNSYATGNVNGTGKYVGGLVGANGGMVGLFGGPNLVTNTNNISTSYATGSVTGGSYVGGLVGYQATNSGSNISNAYATGSVTGSGNYVGGLVGYLGTAAVGTGPSGTAYLGGAYGSAGVLLSPYYGNGLGYFSNVYATGRVRGGSGVGGLVGYLNQIGYVSNAYATGSVSGIADVGGLIGHVIGSVVNNVYATGSVTGSSYVGGLAGYAYGGIPINSGYWNSAVMASGFGLSSGGGLMTNVGGLTTVQMQTASSFGFDFTPNTGTWVIFAGQSNPLLRSLMTPLTVTANSATKTYDGLAYSGGAGVTYSVTPNANLLGTVSYTGTSQGAINAGSYAITPGGLTSAPVQQGYLITYASGALTVNKANLAVTGVTASNRVYDGTTAATLVGTAIVAALGSDVVTVGGTSRGVFADKNVGTGKAVTVSGYTLSGAAAGNYTLVQPSGLTADITPAPSGGVSPVVAQAITALPGGASLLPAFSAAVTSAALPVVNPVVVAMNTLPGLSSAAAPVSPSNSKLADNKEATLTQARKAGVQLQADSFRMEPGSNVTIVNGGIRLPDDMRMSLSDE